MRNDRILRIALASAVLAGCRGPEPKVADSQSQASAPTPSLPAMIVAERSGFIPEAIEYDPASGRLLAGSLPEGTIYQIHPDGRLTAVVTDIPSDAGHPADVAEPDNERLSPFSCDRVYEKR